MYYKNILLRINKEPVYSLIIRAKTDSHPLSEVDQV